MATPEEQASAGGAGAASSAGAAAPAAPGAVNSREDVIRLLDRVCQYYETHEPSSPIPLLLQRAKRLVHKDFLEIMRDLAPDGVPQIENLGGVSSEEES